MASNKYIPRPIEVEAEQLVVYTQKEVPDFIQIHGITFPVYTDLLINNKNSRPYILIPTGDLLRPMQANNMDWIIKDSQGKFWVKTDSQFEREYQKK